MREKIHKIRSKISKGDLLISQAEKTLEIATKELQEANDMLFEILKEWRKK